MEVNEQSLSLMELYLQLQQVEELAQQLSKQQPSRELSLAITNLQQSRLWITESLAAMGQFK